MEAQANMDSNFSRLRDMIQHLKIAMLTTLDDKGNLISRPMIVQKFENEGIIWFFSKKNTSKTTEIQKDERVNVSLYNFEKQLYISVSGAAREEDDKNKIEEMWSENLNSWFPFGKNDPNLTLLRVEIHIGEYWDVSTNKMIELFNIVKSTNDSSFEASEKETISIDQAHNNPSLLTVPYKIDSFL